MRPPTGIDPIDAYVKTTQHLQFAAAFAAGHRENEGGEEMLVMDVNDPVKGAMGQRVVLTGANGFIGRHLAERLLGHPGTDVRILVRRPESVADLQALGAEVVVLDLREASGLDRALAGADVIYHLAGLTRAHTEAELLAVNRDATRTLAAAAAHAAPSAHFVLVSSQAAAGPALDGRPVNEDSPEHPVTAYGRSKLAGEVVVREVLAPGQWTIVRPPAVFGPRERDMFAMFKMVQGGIAPLLGLGRKTFSYIYVHDLVRALILTGGRADLRGMVFFAAAPAAISTLAFTEAIEEALGKRALKPRIPDSVGAVIAAINSIVGRGFERPPLFSLERWREIHWPSWECDSSRLRARIGEFAVTPLADALRETATSYRSEGLLR